MALGVFGFGCEDALIHLLNYVWPNIFETSPHLVQAFMDAVEGMRVALGPIKVLQYALQVGTFNMLKMLRVKILIFIYRVYFILHVKFATFTGKFITPFTSEVKTHSCVDIQEWLMTQKMLLSVANLTMSFNQLYHYFTLFNVWHHLKIKHEMRYKLSALYYKLLTLSYSHQMEL